MSYLLGIDVGTSGTKALICSDEGAVIATASAPHTLQTPRPGWSEQHPHEWWLATCRAVRAVMKKARAKPGDVVGIGFSGQMHGSVFLDARDRVIRPALLWNDQRTASQCDTITQRAGGREKLISLVANPALTGFTAPKVLWLREKEPKNFAKLSRLLLPKDYVRLQMTGVHAMDVADASGTLLLDVRRRAWSDELLLALDLDPQMLPPLMESSDVAGELTRDAAEELGLRAGIAVVAGAGDQAAAAVGNGVVAPGILNMSMGTSGVIFAHSDEPALDPLGRVHTMCHAVPGAWCVFGCMLSAAGSLEWFAEQLASPEHAAARKSKRSVFELLEDEARNAPAGSEGLFFLPYLTGERCPVADPDARGAWIGLTRRTTRAMMIRSLLEGVALNMGAMLDIMRRDMGIAVEQVRATGGGAKSQLWIDMHASALDTRVVLTSSEEGGAYGAAILAGVGAGVLKSVEHACRGFIKPLRTTKPSKKSVEAFARQAKIYNQLYPALRERFAEISRLD